MNLRSISALLFGLSLLMACKNTSKITTVVMEERELEPVEVVANRAEFERSTYNPSAPRKNDLLHTALDVRFDWENQYLNGKATLKLTPYFHPTDSLRLDAKGFDLHKVAIKAGEQMSDLEYIYENNKDLRIQLDRTYTRDEEYTIYIEYTAKPNELPLGGSAAITSDKGLYFINPLNEDPDKPQQIWTQGETESSSCWFPTIDRPNERTTQEIYMTVQDRFKTLSNGILKSSKKNDDGSRTDYWVMDKPHAPYLFMMTVGEFAVVKDEWNGMLLEYYVEAKYEKDAKAIFPYTAEMLSFFSERLGVKYPWQKYSQVVVRDYVSGAMENTTAVIFGDFMQNDTRSLIDVDINEAIVAHEMMHHWFGDLVTCESWANLPLNEAFANYSEYLWAEHKDGRDAADYIAMNEIQGYLNQATIRNDAHPLIYFGYKDKEDMFDAHSYNKGGRILHMLRKYLGDDAFFEGLRVYLEENKYKAAEAHHLRLAFEKVSGEDLNWFFNQWFFTSGHPKLDIKRKYNKGDQTVTISLEQLQDYTESTIFILPMEVAIYTKNAGNIPTRHQIRMTDQKQSFNFAVDSEPLWISVDSERMLLCERKEEQSVEEWVRQYYKSMRFQDRYDALRELKYRQADNKDVIGVFETALADPFWVLRSVAAESIDLEEAKSNPLVDKLKKMAREDRHSDVRATAIEKLGSLENKKLLPLFKEAFAKDQAYRVMYSALKAIERLDSKEAMKMAKAEEGTKSSTLLMAIAEMYSKSGDKVHADFFEKNWSNTTNYSAITFLVQYGELIINSKDDEFAATKVGYLEKLGSNQKNDAWHRYGAANALKKLRKAYFEKPLYGRINTALKAVIDAETNTTLKNLYKNWKVD